MMIPYLGKPPASLRFSEKTLNRFLDNTRKMVNPADRQVRRRKVSDPTAQSDKLCAACAKGKHNCVMLSCSCKTCHSVVVFQRRRS